MLLMGVNGALEVNKGLRVYIESVGYDADYFQNWCKE